MSNGLKNRIHRGGGPIDYRGTELQRWWKRVKISTTKFFNGTACWEWTGPLGDGYGRFTPAGGGLILAHRWAFENFIGRLAEGFETDHLCRNRACVNPLHLEGVTHRENVMRGFGAAGINGRKLFCKKGHPLAWDNIYTNHGKYRVCKICHLERCRRYRNKKAGR